MRHPNPLPGLTLLALLTAPNLAQAQTYTGTLEGTDALIAVVVSADRVVAYTCDGAALALWFRGVLEQPPLELNSTDQTARLTARLSARVVTGRLSLPDGTVRGFRALRSSGRSGLYRSETVQDGLSVTGGWVVLENGEQRGSILGGGFVRPAGQLKLETTPQAALEGIGELNPFRVDEPWVADRLR